jgi:hypothetical protein
MILLKAITPWKGNVIIWMKKVIFIHIPVGYAPYGNWMCQGYFHVGQAGYS